MQSPSEKPQRIGHARRPSLSFHPLYFNVDRHFPLYAHCNSQHHHQPVFRSRPNIIHTLPSRRNDLMQTVDYRYTEKCRRSSFALSDIFELDEEEVEIEISPVLPSAPNSASSISTSTTASVKVRMRAVLIDLAHAVKVKLIRARSTRMHVVEPADRTVKVDLL
ncbi:hypothetical protein C8Q76DRAFT_628207 [Earliella scabrosa]|nr:hypothetical protein C8Q76DRAFT_628207 [Earliella scabrosa]